MEVDGRIRTSRVVEALSWLVCKRAAPLEACSGMTASGPEAAGPLRACR
jgi:hypothetical protein